MQDKSAVICDDDALVRTVIARILEDAGVPVVGEADNPEDLLDEMGRTGASMVILDLALRAGHGEHVLQELCRRHTDVHVIVFSAYVADPMELLHAGAVAVIEKPDFTGLQASIEQHAGKIAAIPNRRRPAPRPPSEMPAPTGITLSGLEPWASFSDAVGHATRGDGILVVDILPNPALVDVWDDVYRVDYRLAAARAIGATRREQDRLSLTPEGLPALLVLEGHPEAPSTMFERLTRVWSREIATGLPVGAFALMEADVAPRETLQRTVHAALEADIPPTHPLRFV